MKLIIILLLTLTGCAATTPAPYTEPLVEFEVVGVASIGEPIVSEIRDNKVVSLSYQGRGEKELYFTYSELNDGDVETKSINYLSFYTEEMMVVDIQGLEFKVIRATTDTIKFMKGE